MFIDFLLDVFHAHRQDDAIVWRDKVYCYEYLVEQVNAWQQRLKEAGVTSGTVVALQRDFSPDATAAFLALIETGCVVVPLTPTTVVKHAEYLEIVQAEVGIVEDAAGYATIVRLARQADHPLYEMLRQRRHPGLVLLSSGTTGQPKAAVHDMVSLLESFKVERRRLRAISFLLFDHIGGINTMLYMLSNAGCLVAVEDRSPDAVLQTIEKHRVELLPTTPTFLNLMLLSEAYRRHDLGTLKTISYGTEPMLESTLQRLAEVLPSIELVQTYGMSEIGILRSRSRSSDSLWVKLGGEGFQIRMVDGILQVKTRSAMLGYLNAPSPMTDDGWLITGDRVEVDGEYFRILGRDSQIINVGGQKVYPAEVESVIRQLDNVAEAVVFGEENAITGQIVCAKVTLRRDEDPKDFKRRLRKHCRERLEDYKVPLRVVIGDGLRASNLVKKTRATAEDTVNASSD